MPDRPSQPVFLDPSGRRWRRLRRTALLAGIVSTLLALAVVAMILSPPLLPEWTAERGGAAKLPALLATRQARERAATRRRLFAALTRHRPPPGLRPAALPVGAAAKGRAAALDSAAARPLTVGFYVNWDDNSRASFDAHVGEMDWVVGEWSFVAPGGDSLLVNVDRRVLYRIGTQPVDARPLAFTLVSNFDTAAKVFRSEPLRRLLGSRANRARTVRQLDALAAAYNLGGVTLDFEGVPDDLLGAELAFVRELRVQLAPHGRLVTQAIGNDVDATWLRRFGAANDKLFLMLYDEHYGRGVPGPVASQGWYVHKLRDALRAVPPQKLIAALGAYGYDWNDAGPDASGGELTFQDVMARVRDDSAVMRFDSLALEPYVTWTDPDSTDHVVWYLDAATGYNQALAGEAYGLAGRAVWRLGSEDPAIWRVIGRSAAARAAADPVTALAEIPPGYDPEFDGEGELLNIVREPTAGRRALRVDPTTGYVAGETIEAAPSPWVIRRYGTSRHRVALTFDDGPDGRWTPRILDTLRSRGAPATFFVIGQNVETHMGLMRRILREGHEYGNHTFTHPNLALTSAFVTRLEVDATERLLEAVLDRRSVFFRAPYFGDAEPTTTDELVPVGIASRLGYISAGLHVDSEDWTGIPADRIVRNVLDQRSRGSVVLLHDSGGDRAATVAALGPLIDSLRARGDTIVPLSELAGIPYDQAIQPLPPRSAAARAVELATFGSLGAVEWVLHWIFLLAVVLGMARLVWVLALAILQRQRGRLHERRARSRDGYAPAVSVVVPAYNEARVITRTIASLLAQDYAGPLEIVVVDDGSPDDTFDVAQAAFGTHPQVRRYRKPNGGKASALDYGIARATGEIVVGLDADTVFPPTTLTALVAPLADPAVGAVAGNAKVGNRVNLVTRWQALEYVTSQNLDRRAFALLDAITVVPGAVGAWRRAAIVPLGGFSDDTLAEDQDLTIAVRRAGWKIAYADRAIAYTEAPDTLGALAKQRFRWSFGTLQCMWKHRDALLRPRYGTLGLVAMPNTWIFQLLFPAISPVADLMFVWSLVSVWLVRVQHGATYAVTNLEQVVTFYAVFLLVDWLAAVVAFWLEPGEDRSLTWLIFLQRFAYRQVMYWVVVRSFLMAIRGRVVGWGKLERKATVQLPA